MDFGYFTLSDNHYNHQRTPEQFILDIRAQAIHADRIGMHSAWIGEHHFDSLGVNSCPDLVLASIIPETKHIRLAPAVTVLPLHHPLRVAETWATIDLLSGGRVDFALGRGYDRKEYEPFGADYMNSLEIMEEGLQVLMKAWSSPGEWSHKGRHYDIPPMAITPRPLQKEMPIYMACFSQSSMELAGKYGLNIIYAPFAAVMTFGGLDKAVAAYRETCARHGKPHGRTMCSYFIHIADTPAEDDYGREAQMMYFNECVIPAVRQTPGKSPDSMRYFDKIVEALQGMTKESLTDKSILIGSTQQIIDSLKKVEAAGIDEVILYFNVGAKPHQMVMDQMERFMKDIAPAFEGKHKLRAAA